MASINHTFTPLLAFLAPARVYKLASTVQPSSKSCHLSTTPKMQQPTSQQFFQFSGYIPHSQAGYYHAGAVHPDAQHYAPPARAAPFGAPAGVPRPVQPVTNTTPRSYIPPHNIRESRTFALASSTHDSLQMFRARRLPRRRATHMCLYPPPPRTTRPAPRLRLS